MMQVITTHYIEQATGAPQTLYRGTDKDTKLSVAFAKLSGLEAWQKSIVDFTTQWLNQVCWRHTVYSFLISFRVGWGAPLNSNRNERGAASESRVANHVGLDGRSEGDGDGQLDAAVRCGVPEVLRVARARADARRRKGDL